jgi:glycosyltransferase involved in cell wall biosynthesis
VVYNAVDLDNLEIKENSKSIKNRLNIESSQKVIGVFSRFVNWKGHNLFLDVAFRLLNERRDLKFILVGSGELKNEIENRVLKSDFYANFIFVGNTEYPLDYMNICDIVVSPSLKEEGFGRSIIEAMSIGRVVLATESGGPVEIIDDGLNGFLAKADEISLYKKIKLILTLDKEKLEEISKNSMDKVKEKFSVQRQIAEINRIYREFK